MLSGASLLRVFESLRRQTFQDFQVTITNSSKNPSISDYAHRYGYAEVKRQSHLLEARFLAHTISRADWSLLLDETRLLRPCALSRLDSVSTDMAVITEAEIGHGLLVNLAELDRKVGVNARTESVNPAKANVLPRLFRAPLLTAAFDAIRHKIPPAIFSRVIYGDHHIITWEAMMRSRSVSIIHDVLIDHLGDQELRDLIKKYYRYGRSAAILDRTVYAPLMALGSHSRSPENFQNAVASSVLFLLRGVPYGTGLFWGRFHEHRSEKGG